MEATVKNNVKVQTGAISIGLDHPTSGYGYFTIAQNGTLSIQTDYGSYDAMWRGQPDMVRFLKGNSVEYLMNNIERSFRNQVSRKKPESIPQFHYKHLEVLVGAFIEALAEVPPMFYLKSTEVLQPKDGRRVIEEATFLKKVCPGNDVQWYIYFDATTTCFLIAVDNAAGAVYDVPASFIANYL